MELRFLTEHDAETWWHLRRLALATDPESFVESVEDHDQTPLEDTRERLRRSDAENFVVGMFADNELAGVAGFYRYQQAHFRHKGYVWGVYVRKESRGKGVAQRMLEEIIRRARQIPGLEQITLIVSAAQPGARRVYERVGFKLYGTEPRSLKIGDKLIDDELMVLFF